VGVKSLKAIKEELKELRFLYKRLAEEFVPTRHASREETKAINENDQIATEKELMKALD
jgi:archaellum component FlaC